MKAVFGRSIRSIVAALIVMFISSVFSQVDQIIYYQYCVAKPDSVCFVPVEGAVDTVGLDVGALGGTFRFCLEVDTIDSGYAPIRVVLVLDESGSMCSHYGPNNCCVEGDGSGYCSKNDPGNKRVDAAIAFVDSLRTLSPESEVGVIRYATRISGTPLAPLPLTSDANVNRIHNAIEEAGCSASAMEDDGLAKTTKTNVTNLGNALAEALEDVDTDYDRIPAYMLRHIVLLTDGAWDDIDINSPDALYNDYRSDHPDRTLPIVHGVFLSDSLTHVQHDYPAHGCSSEDLIDLSYLQHASTSTGGLYFGGTTPQTVVNHFITLLDSVTRTAAQTLTAFTVTNNTNGSESSNATISRLNGSATTWVTTISNLPLDYGPNLLTVKRTIYLPGKGDTTITTNVQIFRSDKYREVLDTDLYKKYCEQVDASISITASPESRGVNEPFDVDARLKRDDNFYLDIVEARVFTKFPDSENGVLATFHLDNNLDNATGGGAGTGTPTFTTTEQLFGTGAIGSGSFAYTIPSISTDFVIEEWVRPTGGNKAVLFSGGGIEIGMNDQKMLYLKSGDTDVAVALIPLDMNVWSHIGIARKGGKVTLYINGIAASVPVAFSTPLSAGAFDIKNPNLWVIDEVRISNTSQRVVTSGGSTTLTIPSVPNVEWVLGEASSTGNILSIPSSAWTSGTNLDFTFAIPVGGQVLINLRQKNAGDVGTGWSKNSNPVEVAADLVGPFITLGTLTPGPIGEGDTLKIDFSEPVECGSLLDEDDPSRTFMISRNKKDTVGLLFNSEYVKYNTLCDDNKYVTSVSLIVHTSIDPFSDSIRIISSDVKDSLGNSAPEGKKAQIKWGDGGMIEIVPVTPNGSDATSLKTYNTILERMHINRSTATDQLVVLTSVKKLGIADSTGGPDGRPSYGYAIIYDAVGNLIMPKQPLLKPPEGAYYDEDHYYILWNGLNRHKRRVANGTYLVRFYFHYFDGREGTDQVKLGIKW